MTDPAKFDVVERLLPVAQEAGMSLTHMSMAFVLAHPQVTSAIIGPRTMEQLDDLLAGSESSLSDDVLDRIDEIAPPGTDTGVFDIGYRPPAIEVAALRRRPHSERTAR